MKVVHVSTQIFIENIENFSQIKNTENIASIRVLARFLIDDTGGRSDTHYGAELREGNVLGLGIVTRADHELGLQVTEAVHGQGERHVL